MSNHPSLTAAYAIDAATLPPDISWWLRVEEVSTQPGATLQKAAEVIDALFSLNPCADQSGPGDVTGGEETTVDFETGELLPPIEYEDALSIFAFILDILVCIIDPATHNFSTEIKVIRSHPDEPYKLIIDNGTIGEPTRMQMDVTSHIVVNHAASVQLEWPVVVSHAPFAWRGPVYDADGVCAAPQIEISGTSLYFGKEVSGAITASYLTEYDSVPVTVHGDIDEHTAGQARITALYHGEVYEHDVQPPATDDQLDEQDRYNFCNGAQFEDDGVGDDVTCYKLVHRITRCQCDNTEIGRETVEIDVECPNRKYYCSGGLSTCRKMISSEMVTVAYQPCPGEENINPNIGVQSCCDETTVVRPLCSVRKSIFRGGKGIIGGIEKYKALYGDNVRLVAVVPKNGICGEVTVRQQLAVANCCDSVADLVYDEDASVSVLSQNSIGTVVFTGGRYPATVMLRGHGFWLDKKYTIRDGSISTGAVKIYTDATACGSCKVIVTDGCSSAIGFLRSVDGNWVVLGSFYPLRYPYNDDDVFPRSLIPGWDCSASVGYGSSTGPMVWATKGKYRLVESGLSLSTPDGTPMRSNTLSGSPLGSVLCKCPPLTDSPTVFDPIAGVFEIYGWSGGMLRPHLTICFPSTAFYRYYLYVYSLSVLEWIC